MNEEIAQIYKSKYGQFIALLLRRFKDLNLESAEDIVQESFADAASLWPKKGLPQNPAGWLFQSSKNKAMNYLKKSGRKGDFMDVECLSAELPEEGNYLKDAQLDMLMACCHPELTPKTQVTLALKYVVNLKVEQIADQLGMSHDAIEKMLYRARQKIKSENISLSSENLSNSENGLSSVHKVIYLIFNEGLKKLGTDISLCEEALLLNTTLINSSLCGATTKALQAIMLFQIARFPARFNKAGKPIELEHQDRSLWNNSLIQLAHKFLLESENTSLSSYHLEASIAYMHCSAKKFEDTDWGKICTYYEVLLKIYPSPFAELNYAVALQYNLEFEKAESILLNLNKNPYFKKSPLFNKTLTNYFERTLRKGKYEL